MIRNSHDSNHSPTPSDKSILSEDYTLPETTRMDHFSPRRIPLKIPDMLRSNSLESAPITENNNTTTMSNLNDSISSTSKASKKGRTITLSTKDKQKQGSSDKSEHTTSSVTEDDLLLAASALEKLKSDKSANITSSATPSPTPSSPPQLHADLPAKPTIFDKMISHPLISNSINYVLEKTINSSNNYIIKNDPVILPALNTGSQTTPLPSINSIANTTSKKRRRESESVDPLESTPIKNKKLKQDTTKIPPIITPDNSRVRRKTDNQNLRQQVSISSAISAQKSLQDLKYLSGLNLNIESRKKLTMLIHFLKLGNSQLSERIDNLIQSVDKKRQKLKPNSSIESRSNSEPDINIQQIKADIVTTVKKIVNVVSKVSAQSLSEPARSNVREALLKLPTNWATMLNNESMFSMGIEDEEDDGEYDDDDDDEEEDDEDEEDAETMTVNNQTIFKRTRKPSISRRLLTSLLQYRKTKGGEIEENTQKVKKWFREKIKDQIMNDSSGKVLILAQESLDMVNKIINFCNESLDKAENWNNDRQHQHQIELLQRLQQITSGLPSAKGKEEVIETMVVRDTRKGSRESSVTPESRN